MSKDKRIFDLVETQSNASLPLIDFAVRIIRVSCKEGIKRDSRRDVKTLFKKTTRENMAKKT
ncbi:MAG: hypothetical protein NUV74_06830 [Candidatus Brocadiaceae bacterium]|nr:hypothetical protein [Candidatus Brocadiaceae bacterium]